MTFEELKQVFPGATLDTWHRHPNGGGWVANTAYVTETVLVGPDALVYGWAKVSHAARVYGNARVCGHSEVCGHAQVFENAYVSGYALVSGQAKIYGRACVFDAVHVYNSACVFGNAMLYGRAVVCEDARVSGNVRVSGNASLCGDLEISGDLQISKGHFAVPPSLGFPRNEQSSEPLKQKGVPMHLPVLELNVDGILNVDVLDQVEGATKLSRHIISLLQADQPVDVVLGGSAFTLEFLRALLEPIYVHFPSDFLQSNLKVFIGNETSDATRVIPPISSSGS